MSNDNNAYYKSKLCLYYPNCRNGEDCRWWHPTDFNHCSNDDRRVNSNNYDDVGYNYNQNNEQNSNSYSQHNERSQSKYNYESNRYNYDNIYLSSNNDYDRYGNNIHSQSNDDGAICSNHDVIHNEMNVDDEFDYGLNDNVTNEINQCEVNKDHDQNNINDKKPLEESICEICKRTFDELIFSDYQQAKVCRGCKIDHDQCEQCGQYVDDIEELIYDDDNEHKYCLDCCKMHNIYQQQQLLENYQILEKK